MKLDYLLAKLGWISSSCSWHRVLHSPKGLGVHETGGTPVQYRGVYSGIDLVYYARDGQVEYDFVVAPTVDAETIVFGIEGGDHVEIDENGDVVITVLGETFRMKKPVVFQEIRGVQEIVAANYFRKDENEFGFLIDRYDSTLPLIIDPVLTYATYLGGSNADTVQEMAVDDAGNAYLTGRTDSLDFPTSPTPFQASFAGGTLDTFVTKLAADGSLVYSTYLGGSSQDFGVAVAVDASGHVYVLGDTDSTDFPTASPFQSAVAGLRDAFVTKLSPDGSTLIYSTYLGGSSSEAPQSIALDNSGNTYLAMFSLSTDYPTTVGAFDTDCGTATNCNFGAGDAVVTKLNPSGSGLVYSTFLGGSKGDNARNIAVNSAGEAYVIGATSSDTDFPLANAAQNSFAGTVDAFVTKLSANGSALLYSTYLGGSGTEDLQGGVIDIAVDSSDHAYVTGNTDSTDFPVLNALQPGSGGAIDSFIAKFDPSGVVQFSTYLGGLGSENATNITVDGSSNIYVSGQVRSDNFPITPDAIQSLRAGSFDVFVTKLSGDGSTILFSTYLGGTAFDAPQGIGLDSVRNVYISGITLSTDFPTSAAFQPSFAGGANDGFVARITLGGPLLSCVGFEPPMDNGPVTVKKNRVLPLKVQLLDDLGAPITDLDLVSPPVIQLLFDSGTGPAIDVTDDALPAGQGTEGNQFEFNVDEWQFNLKTKNYSAVGTYTITMESGDESEYTVDNCVAQFVID